MRERCFGSAIRFRFTTRFKWACVILAIVLLTRRITRSLRGSPVSVTGKIKRSVAFISDHADIHSPQVRAAERAENYGWVVLSFNVRLLANQKPNCGKMPFG